MSVLLQKRPSFDIKMITSLSEGKKSIIIFGQISAALTIMCGSSHSSAVSEMVQRTTELCQFATNFPDPSLKQRNTQRLRIELNKMFLLVLT